MPRRSADIADIPIAQDREKPRSQVRPLPPKVDVFHPADDRFLGEIIRNGRIACQTQCVLLKARR